MMQIVPLFIVSCFVILTTGCSQNSVTVNNSTSKPTTSAVQLTQNSIANQNIITTKILKPKPIRININNLAQPFSSNSASKPPQVIPIPNKPTLKVAPGFVINIFAEGLDAPRWLALTPSGDVLVTETRQNRITILRDRNDDGVADESKTFASAVNSLDISFGMPFGENYFFLGNTNAVFRFPYKEGQQQ